MRVVFINNVYIIIIIYIIIISRFCRRLPTFAVFYFGKCRICRRLPTFAVCFIGTFAAGSSARLYSLDRKSVV